MSINLGIDRYYDTDFKHKPSFQKCVLSVRDLEGNEYPLQATHELPEELNGNKSLSATVLPTKVNKQFIHDLAEMWIIIDEQDTEYKIVYCKRKGAGSSLTVDVKAIPVFFDDFNTQRIYERYDQHMTAYDFFSLNFEGSGYDFVLVGSSFYAQDWEGVGDGETRLSLFKRGLERYKAEFIISGRTIYLEPRIGRDTQFQYRYRLNASNIIQEIDAEGFWTYAKGYGDYEEGGDEDAENNAGLIRKYTSPLAAIIGKREAPPIKNGKITTTETMDEALKTLVDESLKLSISSDIHDMRKQGYSLARPEKGDRVFIIDERIGLNEEVRVVYIKPKRNWKGDILDLQLTFGSEGLSKRHQATLNTAAKKMEALMEGRAKLPFEVWPSTKQQAMRSLEQAQTELIFGNADNGVQGIIAQDEDPNRLVWLNSRGMMLSTDGGATPDIAITADGIVADMIRVGTLRGIRIEGITFEGENMLLNNRLTLKNLYSEIRGEYDYGNIIGESHNPRWFDGDYRLGTNHLKFRSDIFKLTSNNEKGSFLGYTESHYGSDYFNSRLYDNKTDMNLIARVDLNAEQIQISDNWNTEASGVILNYDGSMSASLILARSSLKSNGDMDIAGQILGRSKLDITGSSILRSSVDIKGSFITRSTNDFQGSTIFRSVADIRGELKSSAVYNKTFSGTSNVYVDSSGEIGRSTSAKKYKTDIEKVDLSSGYAERIMSMDLKNWFDKGEVDRNGGSTKGLSRYYGLIAEDLVAAGLSEYAIWTNGELEGIAYDRLWTLLIPIVKKHEERLKQLEGAA